MVEASTNASAGRIRKPATRATVKLPPNLDGKSSSISSSDRPTYTPPNRLPRAQQPPPIPLRRYGPPPSPLPKNPRRAQIQSPPAALRTGTASNLSSNPPHLQSQAKVAPPRPPRPQRPPPPSSRKLSRTERWPGKKADHTHKAWRQEPPSSVKLTKLPTKNTTPASDFAPPPKVTPNIPPPPRVTPIIDDIQPKQYNIPASPAHLEEWYNEHAGDLSPKQRVSSSNPFDLAQTEEKFGKAIEGLESLVQEAVFLAEEAAEQGHLEDVMELIEGASDTLRRASEIPVRHSMAAGSPLRVSSSSYSRSSSSSSSSSSESSVETEVSHRRRVARPPQPTLKEDKAYGTVKGSNGSNLRPDEPLRTDWAYRRPGQPRHKYQSSSDNPSPSSSIRRRGSRSFENEVPKPEPVQITPQEHVEFLSRADGSGNSHQEPVRQRENDHKSRSRRHDRQGSSDNDTLLGKKGDQQYEFGLHDLIYYHTFGVGQHHHRQPIARDWNSGRKRITATLACVNTALLGLIIGIYAGEVPRIQYMLADENHHVILGNVVLYFGLAISTFIFWPLPLLHGRRPYILGALALALPLQFPQASVVSQMRSPLNTRYIASLLLTRTATGFVFGFANVNFMTVLLDLFGASLQSRNPHQEFLMLADPRRHGGGMGLWLGIWSWCFIGSLAVGFQIGAAIIEYRRPDWGFYVVMFLLAGALCLNIMAPETRRSSYRKSITEVYDQDENFITRRISRGEVKLHMSTEAPSAWYDEVWAGVKLSFMMMSQSGFLALALYLGWIYAQIVLIIILLGSLLSREYRWHSKYVGLGVMSVAFGSLFAIPLTKGNLFSRDRKIGARTDSMTFEKQVTWTSHLVRRCIFTLILPFMGLAYTLSSSGRQVHWMAAIIFAGAIGFLSVLAIAECTGLIMETFDTSDLQPGVNTRHRLQSMAVEDRRRRTNYSSFPRVSAGIFAAQSLGFIGAGVATAVGGIMTRRVGAQISTGITAAILLFLTLLLIAVLTRFWKVQVIPDHAFGTRRDSKAWEEFKRVGEKKKDWRPVVIGNPSGKFRRVNLLELGRLSRWTEIRRLNFLVGEEGGEGGGFGGRRRGRTEEVLALREELDVLRERFRREREGWRN